MKDTITINEIMTSEQNEMVKAAVQKERKRLFSFIRKRVPSEEDAEDILQDVFYQLVESYRLAESAEKISSWLFTVARNKITDMFRKKKPESLDKLIFTKEEEGETLDINDLIPGDMESPETGYFRKIIIKELSAALEELPEEQRLVYVMHEIDELSFKEISELTGTSVNTLLSRKRYAVLFLRERLLDIYNELMNK